MGELEAKVIHYFNKISSLKLIKIKFSHPYPNWPYIRQTPNNSGIWKNYQFFINEAIEECDYWVVFNSLLHKKEMVKCHPDNIIFITGEPYSTRKYPRKFLNQFAHIITCQKEIRHDDITYIPQGYPWFVNKSYDELMESNFVKKTKQISIVTSNKQFTKGHRKRFDFSMALKEYFGDEIDLYGRGIRDFDDKWDVLAPYKYSIAIENSSETDYFSEKISDCFLTHTFPLYYGCPNISSYFSEDSYLKIDIDNLDRSKNTIERILNDSMHYEEHLVHLIQAKEKCLNNFNIFPLIVNFIETKKLDKNDSKEPITLQQNFFDPYSLGVRSIDKIRQTCSKKLNEFFSK